MTTDAKSSPTRCQAIVLSEYVSNMVDIETLDGFIVAKLRYKTT